MTEVIGGGMHKFELVKWKSLPSHIWGNNLLLSAKKDTNNDQGKSTK
jgi:hypothetical protein